MDIVLYSENGPHVEVLFRSPDDRDRLRWAMERAMPDMHSWRYLEKNAACQHLGAGEAGESVEDALHES